MADWIAVDMKLHGIEQDLKKEKMLEELKKAGLKKTRPKPPNLERSIVKNREYIKKTYGIDDYITDNYHYYNINYYITHCSIDYAPAYNILKNKNNTHLIADCENDIKNYREFIKNHEKTKKYLENLEKYNKINNQCSKESKFENTENAKPGNLVTLHCPDRDKYYYFLIGSSGNASDLYSTFPRFEFPRIRIVRAKQLVEEFDIVGDLVFS